MKSWQIHSTLTTQVPTGRREPTGETTSDVDAQGLPVETPVLRDVLKDQIDHFRDFVNAPDIHAAIKLVEDKRPGCEVNVAAPTNPGQATEVLMSTVP